VTAKISAVAGHPRQSLFVWALALALLVAPFAGAREFRIVLFGVITLAVAWIQMATNQNTGGSIHHTILLWPLPQLIVAVSFAGVSRRLGRVGLPAVAGVTAVVALSGALVMNEYYAQTVRNGGAPFWTDGVLRLSQYFKDHKPPTWVIAMDWSISDQIRLLHRGRILIGPGTDQVTKPEMNAEDRAVVAQMLAIPDAVWVAHTPEFEIFQGANEKMLQVAAASGYRREMVTVIPDNFGRNVYEVYKMVK